MLTILIRVTVLFAAAAVMLLASKRATAALRHLICVCALAGSLVIPLTTLIPARVATAFAVRLPAITATASGAVAHATQWSTLFLAVWALGCTVLLVRLGVGHWRVKRLIRSATPIRANELYSADVGVPAACGLRRPVVLMPRGSADWPAWQFDAAVRHELTHIERKDVWTILVAHLACAMWWFHPLVWMLAASLRDSQECACDDAVLFSGFEPASYAEALLAVAQTSTRSTLLQGCSMTTAKNLKSRIARLLDDGIARTTSRTNLLRTGIGFAVILAVVATVGLQKTRAQSENGGADGGNKVYTMADGIASPQVVYRVDPQYTEDARAQKIAGTEILNVVVGTDGLAHDISVVKGIGYGLDENGVKAVMQWHFAPGTLHGEPVAVRATIEINFKLL